MGNKCYYFILEGFSSSGAKIGPSTIPVYGETKYDAKIDAKRCFKESRHAIKITRCDSK